MPPKVKYTKEQILEIAFNSVRKNGIDFLSARNIAAELGTSTAPVFTAFENIEELHSLIAEKALKLYIEKYIKEGLRLTPPFKGTGLKYIQFAKDEPQLFRMLFMQKEEEASHFLPEKNPSTPVITETVRQSYGLDEDAAKKLYNHLSVYTHGLAVLYAQHNCTFTMEDVDRMLTEVFTALMQYIKGEKRQNNDS